MMYFVNPSAASRTEMNTGVHRSRFQIRSFVFRFVIVLTILLIAYSAGAMVQARAGGEQRTNASTALGTIANDQHRVFVEQGDTLWTIARAHAPRGIDVRKYIEQVKRLNHLNNDILKAGQSLLLP